MDGLSVAASIIAVVQLTSSCLKLGKKFIGPSQHNLVSLKAISKSLYDFNGTIRNLQTYLEVNEEDQVRLEALNCLAEPLERCKEALGIISERLERGGFLGQYIVRKGFDRKLKKSLHTLEEAKKLFELTLRSDHGILICAVECYNRNVAEDIRNLHTSIDESAGRLLSFEYREREHYDHAERWHGDTEAEIRATKDVALSIEDNVRTTKSDQERQAIINWLSPLNFSATQNETFNRRKEGTGEWLLKSSEFQSWLSTSGNTLWCPGIPGAGKTLLASIVVDYLTESFNDNDDVRTICIYCNYNEQQIQTPINLIASLWRQLVQRQSSLSSDVKDLYRMHTAQCNRPSLSEVSKILQSEVKTSSRIFVIVDALDECPEINRSRATLITELRALQPRVNLMVTSRFLDTIACEFTGDKVIEISASIDDLRMYTEGRISQEDWLSGYVRSDTALGEEIVKTIAENAQHMFLLAQLHTDSIATRGSLKAIREALRMLLRELDDTYDEVMRRINSQNDHDRNLAERVLSWISFAARPLTLEELQCALAVERCQRKFHEDNLIDKKLLTSVCAGLVMVDQKGIICFVHYTTQKYFKRICADRFPAAQREIAETCLTYLSFDEFAIGPCLSDMEMDIRLQKNPLLEYAALHWGDHASGGLELVLRDLIANFLEQEENLSSSIQAMSISEGRGKGYSQSFPRNVSGLSIATRFALKETVSLLLGSGADVEAEDSERRTALHWSAEKGHELVAQLLVENGADIERTDYLEWTPLQIASKNGHLGVVRLFIQWNADVNARENDDYVEMALQWASRSGHLEIVQALLELDADINAEAAAFDGRTALQAASEEGHFEVVQLLLVRGANVNAQPAKQWGITALQAASRGGHLDIVHVLLKYGANVNAEPSEYYGRTALQAASERGYLDIVDLLLQVNAHINAGPAQCEGTTALQAASKNSRIKIAHHLLKCGANVNAGPSRDKGMTALQAASAAGCLNLVMMLLENGAEVNSPPAEISGRTALQAASEIGHLDIIELLLEKGADINARPAQYTGVTALQAASAKGHREIVHHLLNHNAEANGKPCKIEGRTALQAASGAGHLETVELLLKHSAKVNAESAETSGATALQAAAGRGYLNIVQLLLQHGAHVNAIPLCFTGKTALQAASKNGHLEVSRLLLKKEADVQARDRNGWTALHEAADNGHSEVLRLLIDNGAVVDTGANFGRTALWLASRHGHSNVVRLLIEYGVDVEANGDSESTALAIAAEGGHFAVGRLLVQNGADIEAKCRSGYTALHSAAEGGHFAIVRLLTENGTDIEATNNDGKTALHIAASGGYFGIVRLLLEKGANCRAKNNLGHMALRYAVDFDHLPIVRLLAKRPGPKLLDRNDNFVVSRKRGILGLMRTSE